MLVRNVIGIDQNPDPLVFLSPSGFWGGRGARGFLTWRPRLWSAVRAGSGSTAWGGRFLD